jgi:hypothetical protein
MTSDQSVTQTNVGPDGSSQASKGALTDDKGVGQDSTYEIERHMGEQGEAIVSFPPG